MPKDLKLAGERETFKVTLTYDTRDLYGEVTGCWEVVVTSEEAMKEE